MYVWGHGLLYCDVLLISCYLFRVLSKRLRRFWLVCVPVRFLSHAVYTDSVKEFVCLALLDSVNSCMQVTLIESARLPPQGICLKQLVHKPFIAAVPLGNDNAPKIVAQVAGVLDEKTEPPVVTLTDAKSGEELVAHLRSLMVPFTLPTAEPPQQIHGATAWSRSPQQNKLPLPSAWNSPVKSPAHAPEGRIGQGLKVRKSSATVSNDTSRGMAGAVGAEQDTWKKLPNGSQENDVEESDAALVCASSPHLMMCDRSGSNGFFESNISSHDCTVENVCSKTKVS